MIEVKPEYFVYCSPSELERYMEVIDQANAIGV